jgi:hypothetical protein
LLAVSWSPCYRSHPAGEVPPRQPDCDAPCCLRRAPYTLGLRGLAVSGLPLRSLTLWPGDSLTILLMASSMGFRGSVTRPPAIQATGLLALTPAGLPPAEHLRLLWTHMEPSRGRSKRPPPSWSPTGPTPSPPRPRRANHRALDTPSDARLSLRTRTTPRQRWRSRDEHLDPRGGRGRQS